MANLQSIFDPLIHTEVTFLLAVNSAGLAETVLYGIHCVLFFLCIYILLRSRCSTQWFILASAAIMFALSTADTALTMRLLSHDIADLVFDPVKLPDALKLIAKKNPLFVTNNFVADLILLYRCYMVWGQSKYILMGASILVLADTIWGYITMGPAVTLISPFFPVYVWSILGINIVLTIVTVGRIIWVLIIARRVVGGRQLQGYQTAIAVVVESSLVYSACILGYILFPKNSPYTMVMVVVCFRLVAIMPTLLIVQVGLGRVIREGDYTTATISERELRFTSIVLDTFFTTHGSNSDRQTETRPIDEEALEARQSGSKDEVLVMPVNNVPGCDGA